MYRRGAGIKRDHHNKPAKKDVSDSDKYADLLVFGYACKVFRDNDKALFHEQGKHLIPWMGDKNIMIDRYDGRGHLHDLSDYDSGSWNTSYQLSEEEDRIEALCDEERYLAMHADLLDEEARQEEEYKRLSEALADEGTYNAVAFKYSAEYYDPTQPTEDEDREHAEEEGAEQGDGEEPYVAPPGLAIPPDVELPATTKTHAIIERTANFVSQQGAQFEIVLKAKQSGNSQFDFLRFDHYLNPYYRHILKAMKEGRYNPVPVKKEQAQESQSDDSDGDDGHGNYLHPSLFAPKKCSRLEELMKPLQVMDPDHPLAELCRKERERNGSPAPAVVPTPPPPPVEVLPEPVVPSPPPGPPASYSADPLMYYGYYMLPDGTYCLAPPPPGIDANSYYNSIPAGVMPPPPTSSAAAMPPPAVTTPPPPHPDPVAMAAAAAAAATSSSSSSSSSSQVTVSASTAIVPETRPPAAPVAVPAVAAAAIIPPPPDIQPVIDKLAEYVARNGFKFETSVRAKNDPRFDFLQSWHEYYTYYEFKKTYFMQKEGISWPERETTHDCSIDDEKLQSDADAKDVKMIKASFAPICFAIKAKENDMLPLERNRVRLDDDSDEDKLFGEEGLEAIIGGAPVIVKESFPVPTPEEKKPSLSQEELEAKQAKQKLEDRLAAAAREKLAQASKESKEKQLQAERKRKAALFLQNLRGPLAGEPEAKRAELQEAVSHDSALLPAPPAPPLASVFSAPSATHHPSSQQAQKPCEERERATAHRGGAREHHHPAASSSTSSSRGADRDSRSKGGRDKDKKKKKSSKKRRSRSRSREKTRHSLPSAYRRARRSRSRSRSPPRKERGGAAAASDRRHEDRDRERHRLSSSTEQHRRRSRSPHKRPQSSLLSSSGLQLQPAGSSPLLSPSSSPARALSASPASSLGSRGGSQEKDKPVSSTIVSSVQTKITQDLMAKVRAMLATSKTFQPPTS